MTTKKKKIKESLMKNITKIPQMINLTLGKFFSNLPHINQNITSPLIYFCRKTKLTINKNPIKKQPRMITCSRLQKDLNLNDYFCCSQKSILKFNATNILSSTKNNSLGYKNETRNASLYSLEGNNNKPMSLTIRKKL